MERWAAKVIALFVIFFVIFGATLLPIKLYGVFARHGARGVHLVSCLMCFGGGVFLGVYMLHMAPDVRNIFDEALFHPRRITYPVADCVMVAGFFMMVFLEILIKHLRMREGEEGEEGGEGEDEDEQEDAQAVAQAMQEFQIGEVHAMNEVGKPKRLSKSKRGKSLLSKSSSSKNNSNNNSENCIDFNNALNSTNYHSYTNRKLETNNSPRRHNSQSDRSLLSRSTLDNRSGAVAPAPSLHSLSAPAQDSSGALPLNPPVPPAPLFPSLAEPSPLSTTPADPSSQSSSPADRIPPSSHAASSLASSSFHMTPAPSGPRGALQSLRIASIEGEPLSMTRELPPTPAVLGSSPLDRRRESVFGFVLRDGVRVPLKVEQKDVDTRRTGSFQTTSKETTACREYTHIELAPETLLEEGGATRSFTLLFALSLHNVFEGLSIGLKQTVSSVWNLSIAIVAHEVVIGFSLGMQMVQTYRSVRKVVLAAAMCSSMVPLGMLIGLGITETTGEPQPSVASLTTNGALQGLATGVFIYVTFFEILRGELGHGKASIDKMFFMLFGFVVLALLALVPEGPYPGWWNNHHDLPGGAEGKAAGAAGGAGGEGCGGCDCGNGTLGRQ